MIYVRVDKYGTRAVRVHRKSEGRQGEGWGLCRPSRTRIRAGSATIVFHGKNAVSGWSKMLFVREASVYPRVPGDGLGSVGHGSSLREASTETAASTEMSGVVSELTSRLIHSKT